MPVDLPIKVAHVIRDFGAVLRFVEFIEHELEKRIVARLGLVKVEALHSVASAYKNEIARVLGPRRRAEITGLEDLLRRLRQDIDGGIRDARNAQVGHSLSLPLQRIPEHWLFMGHSTFSILAEDLGKIDAAFRSLDPTYSGAAAVPDLDSQYREFWRASDKLGPPTAIRAAQIYAGPWTPDVISMLPGNTPLQDASLRVLGLRLMLRQIGLLILPFWQQGGPISLWERLLLELSLIDFVALEEAVYDGNPRGNTRSLIDEWLAEQPTHKGVALLIQRRGSLCPARIQWRDDIRDKVCAHMDLNVPATMLEVANWPVSLPDFHAEVERLCQIVGEAARLDIRTRYMMAPAVCLPNVQAIAPVGAPRWADT